VKWYVVVVCPGVHSTQVEAETETVVVKFVAHTGRMNTGGNTSKPKKERGSDTKEPRAKKKNTNKRTEKRSKQAKPTRELRKDPSKIPLPPTRRGMSTKTSGGKGPGRVETKVYKAKAPIVLHRAKQVGRVNTCLLQ
jgi:hypothetical protein